MRRDPAGVKGISPFWEAVRQGDRAYVARDFEAALTAYRNAIMSEPKNAIGHLRMGEVELWQGSLTEAEKSFTAALRFAPEASSLKGKALFLLAVLRERQRAFDDAIERWDAYLTFAQKAPLAKTFPATAVERKQRLEQHKKMATEYAAVRERIEKRLAEAEKKARESAK